MSVEKPTSAVAKLIKTHSQYIDRAAPIKRSSPNTSPREGSTSQPGQPNVPKIDFKAIVSAAELQNDANYSPRTGTPLVSTPRKTLSGSAPASSSSIHPSPASSTPTSPTSPSVNRRRFSFGRKHGVRRNQDAQTVDPKKQPSILRGKKAKKVNANFRNHQEHCFSDSQTPHLSQKSIIHIIRQQIDDYMKRELKNAPQVTSPRSEKVIQDLLSSAISTNQLIQPVLEQLRSVCFAVKTFLVNEKHTTEWLENIGSILSETFIQQLTHESLLSQLEDDRIYKIYESVMGKGFVEACDILRQCYHSDGFDLYKQLYAEMSVDMSDVEKIPQQKLFICGAGVVLNGAELASRLMSELPQYASFSMSIGESPMDIQGLHIPMEAGSSTEVLSDTQIQKRFLSQLLSLYYQGKKISRSKKEIDQEVEGIFYDELSDARRFLWMCTAPWSRFEKKVNVIFGRLGLNYQFEHRQSDVSMAVIFENEGYRITKTVPFNCKTKNGQEVGQFEFNWTLIPNQSTPHEEGGRRWNGCIQMMQLPVTHPASPCKEKWGLLTGLIKFDEINVSAKIAEKKVFSPEESEASRRYLEQLDQTFENAFLARPGKYISWYTLEYFVREQCRKALEEDIKNPGGFTACKYAEDVWHNLKTNGQILQPMISRLEILRDELIDMIMSHKKKLPIVDDLVMFIDRLLDTKELQAFLDLTEEGLKHPIIRPKVIYNMFVGNVPDDKGRLGNPQLRTDHIQKIMSVLKSINASSQCLYPVFADLEPQMDCKDIAKIRQTVHVCRMTAEKSKSILSYSLEDIVRTFMEYNVPFYDQLTINKTIIGSEGLGAKPHERRVAFYTKLLLALYNAKGTKVSAAEIKRQVALLCPEDRVYKEVTVKDIPVLPILQLCTINASQISLSFFKYLFNINDAPFRHNVKPLGKSECHIIVKENGKVRVTHKKTIGVFGNPIPERVVGGVAHDPEKPIAEIPFTWELRLSPIDRVEGRLQIQDVREHPGIGVEDSYQLGYRVTVPTPIPDLPEGWDPPTQSTPVVRSPMVSS